jgi:type IV pilus biogenesis protein CpaD/CtpE
MRTRALVSLLLMLSGCAASDPYGARGLWQPTGANAGNLAAMAANKRDLIAGRGLRTPGGSLQSEAVERLWQGKTYPLGTGAAGATAAGGTQGRGGS